MLVPLVPFKGEHSIPLYDRMSTLLVALLSSNLSQHLSYLGSLNLRDISLRGASWPPGTG